MKYLSSLRYTSEEEIVQHITSKYLGRTKIIESKSYRAGNLTKTFDQNGITHSIDPKILLDSIGCPKPSMA